jgi:peptidoglycan/LPS O-acetylase OafA/YrhL
MSTAAQAIPDTTVFDLGKKNRSVTTRAVHKPQLDALRCFAVFMVLWGHEVAGRLNPAFGVNGFGIYGAWLFFVLSGFLISQILLRARDEIATGSTSTGQFLRHFHIRRVLRVAPAFLALIVVVAVFDLVPGVRQDFFWHATYMSNWGMFVHNKFALGVGSFWTLAVEVHFYLLWPIVILATPKRRLPHALIAIAILSVLFRALMATMYGTGVRIAVPTFSSFDCLAIGSLLAWHVHEYPKRLATRNRALFVALLAGVGMIMLTVVMSLTVGKGFRLFAMVETLGMSLVSVFLVGNADAGFKGIAGRILRFPPIVYLGVISYGIYLYHGTINWGLRYWPGTPPIARVFGASSNGWQRFVLVSILSIVVASGSWFFFEKPINLLKKRFPYS